MQAFEQNGITFWGQRSYDCSGRPLKLTRNVLRELGYVHVRDHKGLCRLIPIQELDAKNKGAYCESYPD